MVGLVHMRNFVAVAERGQFSRAAEELHLSQPSLSLSVKQLELLLGTQLLIRHSRGVRLTSAGEAFLPRARAALAAAEAAVEAARTHAQPQTVVVGFVPPWNLPASELLYNFRRAHPDVPTEMRQLNLTEQSTAVRAGRVDVTLAWEPDRVGGVTIERLRREPRMVCLAASHRLAARAALRLEDIADEPVPGRPPGVEAELADAIHLTHLRTRPLRYAPVAPQTVDETAALIAGGDAICMGPESLARAFLRDGLVIRPLLGVEPAEMSLVWRSDETAAEVISFVQAAKRTAAVRRPIAAVADGH